MTTSQLHLGNFPLFPRIIDTASFPRDFCLGRIGGISCRCPSRTRRPQLLIKSYPSTCATFGIVNEIETQNGSDT